MMPPQEEESLFAAYAHPPMMLPQEGKQVQQGYEMLVGEGREQCAVDVQSTMVNQRMTSVQSLVS